MPSLARKPFGQPAHLLQLAAVFFPAELATQPHSAGGPLGCDPPGVLGVETSPPWALVSRDLSPSCLGALAHWVSSSRGLSPATRRQRGTFWSCGIWPRSLRHSGDGVTGLGALKQQLPQL